MADYPVLILMFGMEGCPACEATLPRFVKVRKEFSHIPAYAIDSNRNSISDVADRLKVSITPTTFLLRYGRIDKRFEGEASVADFEKLFRYADGL